MLHRRPGVAVTFFDLLAVEGLPTTMQPYSGRRTLLEQLEFEAERVRLVATLEDGGGAVCCGLRARPGGVVPNRERDPYPPRERQMGEDEEPRDCTFVEGAGPCRPTCAFRRPVKEHTRVAALDLIAHRVHTTCSIAAGTAPLTGVTHALPA